MTDIARHRAGRLRVMNAIYEAAEGSRMSHVSGGWLLEHLELSDEELGGICGYLEGERLITAGREHWGHHTPFMILLTHTGIEEMKQSREAPGDVGHAAHLPTPETCGQPSRPRAGLPAPRGSHPQRLADDHPWVSGSGFAVAR